MALDDARGSAAAAVGFPDGQERLPRPLHTRQHLLLLHQPTLHSLLSVLWRSKSQSSMCHNSVGLLNNDFHCTPLFLPATSRRGRLSATLRLEDLPDSSKTQ